MKTGWMTGSINFNFHLMSSLKALKAHLFFIMNLIEFNFYHFLTAIWGKAFSHEFNSPRKFSHWINKFLFSFHFVVLILIARSYLKCMKFNFSAATTNIFSVSIWINIWNDFLIQHKTMMPWDGRRSWKLQVFSIPYEHECKTKWGCKFSVTTTLNSLYGNYCDICKFDCSLKLLLSCVGYVMLEVQRREEWGWH